MLKTLEEPPGDTVFMLVSDRSGLLPATIRSRCQSLAFPCPPAPVALSWLESRIDAGQPAPTLLALAHGAPLGALELARRSAARVALHDGLASLLEGSADPVSVAERWSEHGIDEVSWWLIGMVQEAIRARAASASSPLSGDILPFAHKRPLTDWFRLLDCCLAARSALARQINLNERLALESLALACRPSACEDVSVAPKSR